MHSSEQKEEVPFEFDADSLAFDMGNEPVVAVRKNTKQIELTPEDVKDAHWFYDTPGITKENCVCVCVLLETFMFNFRSTFLTGQKKKKQKECFHFTTQFWFLHENSSRMNVYAANSVFTLLASL